MESYDRTIRISLVSIIIAVASIVALGFYIASSQALPTILIVGIILILITIVLGILQVFDRVQMLGKGRVQEPKKPLIVTVDVSGLPVTIEALDVEQVEEVLELVERLHTQPSSSIKIKVPETPDTRSEKSEVVQNEDNGGVMSPITENAS